MVAVKQVKKNQTNNKKNWPSSAHSDASAFYCSKTTINDVATSTPPKSPGPAGVLPVTVRLVLTVTNTEHFLWATAVLST